MTFHHLPALRAAAIAAVLAFTGLQAQAADFEFSGSIDSGFLAGQTFSGSFSYELPADGFDGAVALTAFSLSLAGQAYDLPAPSADAVAKATFSAGQFLGIDYATTSPTTDTRPAVQMVSGFTDVSTALLFYSYADGSALTGGNGFGSYTVTAAPVPEPSSWALMLGGLALAGAAVRRQRRG